MRSTANASTIATIDSKKPNTKQELIAVNIKLLIEQLEAGHSDALTNYLTAMSRFHNYSFGNVLEIARQMPTATRVAGFWTWKNLGRSVKAGQKGIRILAPIIGVRRKKDEDVEKDITKQNARIVLGFRNAYVFDVSQTEGVDLPDCQRAAETSIATFRFCKSAFIICSKRLWAEIIRLWKKKKALPWTSA